MIIEELPTDSVKEETDKSASAAGPEPANQRQTLDSASTNLPKESLIQTVEAAGPVEVLIGQMLLGGHDRWVEVLHQLVLSLGASGGEVGIIGPPAFLGTKADPQILFSCGDYQRTSDRQDVIKFFYDFWSQREAASGFATTVMGSEPVIACCASTFSKNELLGIVVWGDASACFDDLTLLRVFARLLVHLLGGRNEASMPPGPGPSRGRSFQEGYVEGCSDMMTSLHQEIEMLSQVDFPVLLLGETGVGKEHLAQLLHLWSNRSQGPFIAVNCAAIPTELLEAEMFGIGRGVASGVLEREGYFQLAEGGTLFLDEIAELQPSLQAKLLRALQDKEVRRVGGAAVKHNVRVLAATNADLRRRMESGSFRADLYYRIAGFELVIPPLRERKGDLPLFIEHFLRLFSKEVGKTVPGLTLKTLELLNEYHWPGNVREFAHEIRRLVYLCPDGQPIDSQLLSARIFSQVDEKLVEEGHDLTSLSLDAASEKLERRLITEALRRTRGNRTKAAKLLGVTRNGLAIKMERLRIDA